MLTCKEFDDFLTDFVDGNLPLRQRLSMHMHLSLCKDCRDFVEEYRRALHLGRSACRTDESLGEVPEALVQAVLTNLKSLDRD